LVVELGSEFLFMVYVLVVPRGKLTNQTFERLYIGVVSILLVIYSSFVKKVPWPRACGLSMAKR